MSRGGVVREAGVPAGEGLKDLGTLGRIGAWASMLFVDHGLFRLAYNNLFHIGGGMYRCSQPSPGQLRRYQRKYGIKTVINLRGSRHYGSYRLEVDACRRLGITMLDAKLLKSRLPPEQDAVRQFYELFTGIEYPALMHCKSGADRAGLAAALYRMLRLGEPVDEAVGELRWFYGHFKQGQTGILDRFLDEYAAYSAENPISLIDWSENVYDRSSFHSAHRGSGWANWLINDVLKRE